MSFPFTPSTECLSHHSLPLLLAPKKIKTQKIKAESKAQKASSNVCHVQGRHGDTLRHMRLRYPLDQLVCLPPRVCLGGAFLCSAESVIKLSTSPSRSSNRLDKLGYGQRVMGKRGSGFWWDFGEATAARKRVAAMEDEVLWPCGWTCLWVWNPFLWPYRRTCLWNDWWQWNPFLFFLFFFSFLIKYIWCFYEEEKKEKEWRRRKKWPLEWVCEKERRRKRCV